MSRQRSLLTVKQAAASLGVSESLVYAWCRQRLLPHYRFGLGRGKIMIDQAQLDEFLESKHVIGFLESDGELKHLR
jgi:excisionase family DNA binding protein